MLAHLAGPVAIPNSQLFSTVQSRDQAALLYALAAFPIETGVQTHPRVSR
jgi:hypothetical protein